MKILILIFDSESMFYSVFSDRKPVYTNVNVISTRPNISFVEESFPEFFISLYAIFPLWRFAIEFRPIKNLYQVMMKA